MRAWTSLVLVLLAGCSAPDGPAASAPTPRPQLSDDAPEYDRVPASPPSSPLPSPSPTVVARGDGRLAVVPGTGAVAGDGRLRTYVVEVEGGLGLDPVAFAEDVEQVLADPRSWIGGGGALRRVDGGPADLRVALASPRTTDGLCAPLRTNGRYSCAQGERAVLNAARWLTGAAAYGDRIEDYRAYLVNHEVGHALGERHAACPGRGAVAPVMLQQTKGLDGCLPGPWPYP